MTKFSFKYDNAALQTLIPTFNGQVLVVPDALSEVTENERPLQKGLLVGVLEYSFYDVLLHFVEGDHVLTVHHFVTVDTFGLV